MVRGSMPARPTAWATASICPSMLGAVKPTLPAPSLLIALPSTTARMVSPSAIASERRLSRVTPTPLPQTVPLAPASNGRHRPSGEVKPSMPR
ncbi:hypothetical protein B0E53_06630 [Micromonospora sp. MH33]|nr:hypothetical protein B0E53_06630 [Micromonospora sp. MH33]